MTFDRPSTSTVTTERDRLCAENRQLREAIDALLAVQIRVQSDPHWRTNDNSLWPDMVAAHRQARAAVDQTKAEKQESA